MTLRIQDGDLLIDSGSLANSADCCCDEGDCCDTLASKDATVTLSLGSSSCCDGLSGDFLIASGSSSLESIGGTGSPLSCNVQCDAVPPFRTPEQCHADESCYQHNAGGAQNAMVYVWNLARIQISYTCSGGTVTLVVVITWFATSFFDNAVVPSVRDCNEAGGIPSGPSLTLRRDFPDCGDGTPGSLVEETDSAWFPYCTSPSITIAFTDP